MPEDADLYVEPPAGCRSPVRELHELAGRHGSAAMLGVFSLPDGRQLFHVRLAGDTAALERSFLAAGWSSQPRPD